MLLKENGDSSLMSAQMGLRKGIISIFLAISIIGFFSGLGIARFLNLDDALANQNRGAGLLNIILSLMSPVDELKPEKSTNVISSIEYLRAYFQEISDRTITLEIGNLISGDSLRLQPAPIEILNVTYGASEIFWPKQEPNILQSKREYGPVRYETIEFVLPEGLYWSDEHISDLKLNYRLLGTSQLRSAEVYPWSHLSEDFIKTDFIRRESNVEEFDFLVVDNVTKKILVAYGNWELTESLIIPAGYTVVCPEGTRLDLKNTANILSYSPLQFFGSEDNPIIVTSSDSDGQGIAVLKAGDNSILENVIFQNLSAPSQSGWELTGAITFYESPVEITGCQFLDSMAGDDVLNIIRTEFEIKNSLFEHSPFDALDIDFGKGSISHTSFVNCGNDGIDISGSVVHINGCLVNGVGDKGISVGENSWVTTKGIELKDCYIALASKDMSQVEIAGVTVSSGDIGFAVYQKKSEFGPSKLTAAVSSMVNVTTPYLVEEDSLLVVDNQKINTFQKNVYSILYDNE
jgi:hypothetical protein|tara:strand:- start:2240 stop:3796 length:1557 start_codon:yes stop_codon:yes gene_type:complete